MTAPEKQPTRSQFLEQGSQERPSFFAEYFAFLKRTRKWWILPLLIIVLLFGALVILSSTGAAPFIYTLF